MSCSPARADARACDEVAVEHMRMGRAHCIGVSDQGRSDLCPKLRQPRRVLSAQVVVSQTGP